MLKMVVASLLGHLTPMLWMNWMVPLTATSESCAVGHRTVQSYYGTLAPEERRRLRLKSIASNWSTRESASMLLIKMGPNGPQAPQACSFKWPVATPIFSLIG
ncbi:hypothetical protein BDR06DRAFT_702180 [Suillus hirtellus]|nr:hypothetical protein BDR06DRAFT_702180 [Suillus hirtellus]